MRLARALLAALLALLLPLEALAQQPQKIVALVPLGKIDRAVLDAVAAAIEQRVNVKVRLEEERPLPPAAFYKPRSRWRAEKILAALDADPPPQAFKTVALTAAEISTTKGTIVDWRVGGLGSIGGPSCVLSTWIFERFSKSKAQVVERTVDVAVHELGHTLGLEHCTMHRCVMRDAQGKILTSVDSSTGQYCGRCRMKVAPGLLR